MQPGEPEESPERAGPVPLPDDTWDTAPTRTHDHVRSHRLPGRPRSLALILAGVVVAVVAVVLIVMPDRSPTDPTAAGDAPRTTSAREPATPNLTTSAPATTTDAPVADDPPPGNTFTSVGYEAEAGMPRVRVRHSAVVRLDGASGGAAVQLTSDRSEIEVRSVGVPTASDYRVTIVYASDGGSSIEVRGSSDSHSVPLAAAGCCGSVSLMVRLSPGGSLSISPSQGDGPLPAIDRIVIERA